MLMVKQTKMNRLLKYIIPFSFFIILLSSCKVTQTYNHKLSVNDNLFRDTITSATTSFADLSWKEVFLDTNLQILISEGIKNNPGILQAYTRVNQAQAYYEQSGAAFLPSLSANANVTYSKLPENQLAGIRSASQYQLGVSSVWEADIWGKLRSNKRAQLANLLQSRAGVKAVQTSIVSNVATYYYNLLALDKQLEITRKTVYNWDTTVTTLRALKESGRVTEAAVVQSLAQRYAAEVTIPDLKQKIRETENALSILIGRSPSEITRTEIDEQQIPEEMKIGVPASLLANRPDVEQAELNLRYYFELTNVARTYFYPSLSITGSTGLGSLKATDLFNPSAFIASIGGGLTQPIFNNKQNKTRLKVAKAEQENATLNFQNTLLTAGQEVSNALSLYDNANEKASIRTNQIDALNKSVDYTQQLLENGFATYTEIITARQSLLQVQLGQVNDKLQALLASVNLYRSLGGGWK